MQDSDSLQSWLDWLETIHPSSIDMTLERVSSVAARLKLTPVDIPIITVAGTNGKGSTVAMLSAIYSANGYKTGCYTSPHIVDFRERIKVDGVMAAEASIVHALSFIEQQRKPETLTYFEYTTLAAMKVFVDAAVDVIVLEVGLGGRLDATNIWDTDCAILTSIALDHESYLGSDLSVIATEKAAIGRRGKPFIIGEADPPESLGIYVTDNGYEVEDVGSLPVSALPQTSVPGAHQRRNAACAVAAVRFLSDRLPVKQQLVDDALLHLDVDGRFSRYLKDGITVITDVAHNPAGAAVLAETWRAEMAGRNAHLVFAALGDKDIAGVTAMLAPVVSSWHCATLDDARAIKADEITTIVKKTLDDLSEVSSGPAVPVTTHDCTEDALQSALDAAARDNQAVLVCGSFLTIADVQQSLL